MIVEGLDAHRTPDGMLLRKVAEGTLRMDAHRRPLPHRA